MSSVIAAPTRTQPLVYRAPAPSQRSLPSAVFVVDLDALSLPRMTKTAAPASHGGRSALFVTDKTKSILKEECTT
jgi:hypothetical protein